MFFTMARVAIAFRESAGDTGGIDVEKNAEKSRDLFWVCWLAKDVMRSAAYRAGSQDACLTLDEAKVVLNSYLQVYGDDAIAVWIERHDYEGKKLGIPVFVTCVDAVGSKRVIRDDYEGC